MKKQSIMRQLDLLQRQIEDYPTFNHKDTKQKKFAKRHLEQAIRNVRNM